MTGAVPTRVVVVGATSVLAVHVLRRWVQAGTPRVHLVGRDAGRLAAVADDLRARSSEVEVTVSAVDLVDPASVAAEIASSVADVDPDTVLIAHGNMLDQAAMQQDLGLVAEQLIVGGVSPVLWLEGFADAMPSGIIAILGSPAGDRGRAKNYLYGASKSMIERAAQGLQHRVALSGGPAIVLIKPGPTRTPMTASTEGNLAEPADVAKGIDAAVVRRTPVAYVPGIWRWVMLIVRLVPRAIFHRTNF